MTEIAARLGIDPKTISSGGSVLRDFLEDVASAVGTPKPASTYPSKARLLEAIVTKLTSHDAPYKLNGGTVTNSHLDDVLHGLDERDVASAPKGRPQVKEPTIPDAFDFAPTLEDYADARRMTQRIIAMRERAPKFREALLAAYEGQCAMSGSDVKVGLEAAHIYPYRGAWTNAVQNGLLLRADIHRAFDAGLVTVRTSTWQIEISDALAGSSLERELRDRLLRLPAISSKMPSRVALDRHREAALA